MSITIATLCQFCNKYTQKQQPHRLPSFISQLGTPGNTLTLTLWLCLRWIMACLQNPVIDGVMFIPDKAICFDRPSEAACASEWLHSLICDCSPRGMERLLPPDSGCHYQIEGSEMDRPLSSHLPWLALLIWVPSPWEWHVILTNPCNSW